MFVRHGIRQMRRTWRKTLLLLLLTALLTVLLATSLGMSHALRRTLQRCREDYVTVGVAEYIGPEYPTLKTVDAPLQNAAAALAAQVAQEPDILRYEPTRTAFGYIRGTVRRLWPNAAGERAVLAAVNRGYNEEIGGYYMVVQEALFSDRDVNRKMIFVDAGDRVLETDHVYLFYGTYFYNGAYTSIGIEAYEPDAAEPTDCVDVTEGDGYRIPESSVFHSIAATCTVANLGLTVWATDAPEELFPFQQEELRLTGGSFALGEDGCLIAAPLARQLGCTVGDSLSLATVYREGQLPQESYDSRIGFEAERTYRVAGIFEGNEERFGTVFVPSASVAEAGLNSYTLGQIRFPNGRAEEILSRLTLPEGVRVTVYDQGFAAVERSLSDMLRLMTVIAAVCLAAGAALVILLGYLLVYRQRGLGWTMYRLGCSYGNILTYYMAGMAVVALPAAAIGFGLSLWTGRLLTRLLAQSLQAGAAAELRFSSAALSVARSSDGVMTPPGAAVLLAIAAATAAAALLSCLMFCALSVRPHRARRRIRRGGRRAGRTQSLRGGAARYAWLSVVRGGVRSLLPAAVALCAAVLFFRLSGVLLQYEDGLQTLRGSSSVRGNFTDLYGQKTGDLSITEFAVRDLASMDGIDRIALTYTFHYEFVYVLKEDGTRTGPGLRTYPAGSFGQETYLEHLRSCDRLVLTNSLRDAPEFLYSHGVEITYADGYDDTLFTAPPGEESVCVLPTALMERYGIALGDRVWLEVLLDAEADGDSIEEMVFRVVGSFAQAGSDNNIYLPLSLIEQDDTSDMQHAGWMTMQPRSVEEFRTETRSGLLVDGFRLLRHGAGTYHSATFTVPDCTKLPAVREAFAEKHYSQVGKPDQNRTYVVLQDAAYLQTERTAAQRLWYMQALFPMVYGLTEGLGLLLAFLLTGLRRRELRVMRSVGTPPHTARCSLWLEQVFLCPAGVLLGTLLAVILGWRTVTGALLSAGFAAAWLFGTWAALRGAAGRTMHRGG